MNWLTILTECRSFRRSGLLVKNRPSYLTVSDKREKYKEQIDDLIVDRNQYLEEIQYASNSFLTMKAAVESFEYHYTLVEKKKLLA